MHSHLTRSSKTNFVSSRLNNKYGHKSQAYEGSKLWTDLASNFKYQSNLKRYEINSYNVFMCIRTCVDLLSCTFFFNRRIFNAASNNTF